MLQGKVLKKYTGLTAMLAAMALALPGCGSAADQTDTAKEPEQNAETQSSEDTVNTETENADAAADSEKVELRFLLWGNQKEKRIQSGKNYLI